MPLSHYRGAEAGLRLARILEDASRTARSPQGKSLSAWEILSKVLDFNESSVGTALRRMNRLRELPLFIRKDIRKSDLLLPESYLTSLARLESLFARSPTSQSWATWDKALGPGSTSSLRYMSSVLDPEGTVARRTIPRDGLIDIRTQLSAVAQDLSDVDCPRELHDYLVGTIEAMIDAIDDYRVIGLSGLLSVMESAQAELPAEDVLDKAPPKVRRALMLVALVAFVTHLITQGAMDVEQVMKQLPWVPQSSIEIVEHQDSVILQIPEQGDDRIVSVMLHK